MYGQPVVSNPVSNPVIYGRFPKYAHSKSPIEKINKALKCLLLCLVALSLVSYYFVFDGQKTMNSLGREIVALSNENIELQNRLDNLNSFNNVDAMVHGISSLDAAKQVIEIPAVNRAETTKSQVVPVNYSWSFGY